MVLKRRAIWRMKRIGRIRRYTSKLVWDIVAGSSAPREEVSRARGEGVADLPRLAYLSIARFSGGKMGAP